MSVMQSSPQRDDPRLAWDPPSSGSGGVSFLTVARVLLRHRLTIVVCCLLVAAAVVTLTLSKPRSYTATASFSAQTRGASQIAGLASSLGLSLGTGDATQSPQFYADLMVSREILGAVLDSAVRLSDGRTRMLVEHFRISAPDPRLRRADAIRSLKRHVKANVSQKTGVVSLSVQADDPMLAEQVARRILGLLEHFNQETRRSQAAAERQFTERRLAEVSAELRAAENRLAAFLDENRAYTNSPTLHFTKERLERDVSRQAQLYTSLVQAFEEARIEEVRDTPVITVVEAPEVPMRPDPRELITKLLLGLLAGATLGVVLAFLRSSLQAAGEENAAEYDEVSRLSREAVTDITHPWRPLARMFTRRR